MDQSINDWLNWLRVRRSASTVSGYAWELRKLAAAYPGRQPVQFKRADLTRYLAERRLYGAGDNSIKRSVAAFRSFFGYIIGEKKSPAAGVPFPRPKRRQQRALTAEQALAVLSACDTSTRTGQRDLALLCLMLDSGLRAAEACRLRLADVDLARRVFRVVVKGGDQRGGVFCAYTAGVLGTWLSRRGTLAIAAGCECFFVSVRPGQASAGLTTSGLRVVFRRIGQRAGLTAFSPHDLRRTFATLAHRRGAPSRLVQIAGRWENLEQLRNYTESLTAEDFAPYSPVAGIMGVDT